MPTLDTNPTRLAAMYERLALDAARDVLDLRDRVHDLEGERDIYREALREAIHECARLTALRRRDAERHRLLAAEVRRLRPRQPRPRPPSPMRRAA